MLFEIAFSQKSYKIPPSFLAPTLPIASIQQRNVLLCARCRWGRGWQGCHEANVFGDWGKVFENQSKDASIWLLVVRFWLDAKVRFELSKPSSNINLAVVTRTYSYCIDKSHSFRNVGLQKRYSILEEEGQSEGPINSRRFIQLFLPIDSPPLHLRQWYQHYGELSG